MPPSEVMLTRRRWLQMTAWSCASLPSLRTLSRPSGSASSGPGSRLGGPDLEFLKDLIESGCRYFLENRSPTTGLTKDRANADGPDARPAASTAATGFGLTALCIAAQRGIITQREAEDHALLTLRFLDQAAPQEHGIFYHFINAQTGERFWKSEASSIDTALLMGGVLSCGEYFRGSELRRLVRRISDRVEWTWLLGGDGLLHHGYRPETGMLRGRWESYCEHMLLYLLAIGSRTHPIPKASWDAWDRPIHEYEGVRYIGSDGPLFIHQFSHAWVDFRGIRDRHADYWQNSVRATEVHRRFCRAQASRFPKFGEDLWGITASDSATGYQAWGGPPESGSVDGTIVPCAAAGSLPFAPGICLSTLRHQRERYGSRIWRRYGFVDSFNPQTGWVNPDVIGIDVGISLLMAENLLTGGVWKLAMKSQPIRDGLGRAGFRE